MAMSEGCEVWIKQRIEEELEEQPFSGKSLRAIGRESAKEIETKIKPGTFQVKATRMKLSGSNDPPPTARLF